LLCAGQITGRQPEVRESPPLPESRIPVKESYVAIHLAACRQQALEGNLAVAEARFRRADECEAEGRPEYHTRLLRSRQDRSADGACADEIHRKQLEPASQETKHPAPEGI